MKMQLETLQKIELFCWILTGIITVFYFSHFCVFLALVFGVRCMYNRCIKAHFGRLPTEGKSVLITGCDSGFGLALANRLHAKGFKVYATCLSLASEGAQSLKSLESDRMKVVPLDVTNDDMVVQALQTVEADCENTGLWGLVNNSGMNGLDNAEMTTMAQYEKLCNVNLFGMIRVCRAFIPLVRKAKGRIVNVTSVKGRLAIHGSIAYIVSKFGAQAFSEVLRQEMRPCNVTVITIEPGNFSSATGILNGTFIAMLSAHLESMWKQARPEVQLFYGSSYIQNKMEEVKGSLSRSHPSMDPVIDAEEDALTSACPQSRYLIGGTNTFIDKSVFLVRMAKILPEDLFDRLRDYLRPYSIQK